MARDNIHPEDIKAALRKRYGSLREAAEAQGISEALIQKALRFPRPGGNAAIAKALGKNLNDLWPRWFDEKGRRLYLGKQEDSSRETANHCQKGVAA